MDLHLPNTFSNLIAKSTFLSGCKTENDLKPEKVEDSVQFLIDDTNYAWDVEIRYNDKDIDESCNFKSLKLGDGGVYTIIIKESEDSSSDSKKIPYKCFPPQKTKDPSDFWKPIWLTFVILIVVILILIILMVINKRYPMLREEALKKIGKWSPEDEVSNYIF